MRIGELSQASGVPLPTIKYYLRERLLPAGVPTGRNQAEYGDDHLARLRLVRALLEVGRLSVAAVQQVLAAVDDPEIQMHDLLGTAHYAITDRSPAQPESAQWQSARAEVARTVEERGWCVDPDSPAFDLAADALTAFTSLGAGDLVQLDVYAAAAEEIARTEVAAVAARKDAGAIIEGVVFGTVFGEALFNALRRLAQQNASIRLFGLGTQSEPEPGADPRVRPGAAGCARAEAEPEPTSGSMPGSTSGSMPAATKQA